MPRNWRNKPGDNTGRTLEMEEQLFPDDTQGTIRIFPVGNESFVRFNRINGDLIIDIDTEKCQQWDKLTLLVTNKELVSHNLVMRGGSVGTPASGIAIPNLHTAVLTYIYDDDGVNRRFMLKSQAVMIN